MLHPVCWTLGENYSENTSPYRLRILWTASSWSCTEELGNSSSGTAATAAAAGLLLLPRVPRVWEHQHKAVTPETQQLLQHHQHIYLIPWGAGGSYHTPLPPHTQQCHHLPWTDLQISTPETCSFPMYPTAKGHQFVPTDFPHNPTQRLLFFWLFSRFGLNTQLFFHMVFKRKFSCATSVYCLNLQR